MVDVSVVRESVRVVISGVFECAWRALMTPALSPSATEARFPRYTALEGSVSPHVTAPLSVIDAPAAMPSRPDPSVNTSVEVGLFSLIALIQAVLSSTLGCLGVKLTWSWTLDLLDGSLEPKDSFWGWLVTVLDAAPMVESGVSSKSLFIIESGCLV